MVEMCSEFMMEGVGVMEGLDSMGGVEDLDGGPGELLGPLTTGPPVGLTDLDLGLFDDMEPLAPLDDDYDACGMFGDGGRVGKGLNGAVVLPCDPRHQSDAAFEYHDTPSMDGKHQRHSPLTHDASSDHGSAQVRSCAGASASVSSSDSVDTPPLRTTDLVTSIPPASDASSHAGSHAGSHASSHTGSHSSGQSSGSPVSHASSESIGSPESSPAPLTTQRSGSKATGRAGRRTQMKSEVAKAAPSTRASTRPKRRREPVKAETASAGHGTSDSSGKDIQCEGDDMTRAEFLRQQRQLRLVRNRESANKSRARRKAHVAQLEIDVVQLRKDVIVKDQRIAALETENKTLRDQLNFLKDILGRSVNPEALAGMPSIPAPTATAVPTDAEPDTDEHRAKRSRRPTSTRRGRRSSTVLMAVVFVFAICLVQPFGSFMGNAEPAAGGAAVRRAFSGADGVGNRNLLTDDFMPEPATVMDMPSSPRRLPRLLSPASIVGLGLRYLELTHLAEAALTITMVLAVAAVAVLAARRCESKTLPRYLKRVWGQEAPSTGAKVIH